MSNQIADHVSYYIDEKLAQLSPTPFERCIFRAPNWLRKENEKAFEPEILSIGPYHHGKDHLKAMEENKLRYLKKLIERRNETSVDKYVGVVRKMEERARKYYAEPIDLNADEFVEMILLDGLFIIELFRKSEIRELIDADDPIYQLCSVRNVLRRDLLLFENQLPFFIIVELFNMTKVAHPQDDIIRLSLTFLEKVLLHQKLEVTNVIPIDEIKHILGLVHYSWCFSFAETRKMVGNVKVQWEFIDSASELQEAGVQFKMVKRSSLFDIRFTNGVMEIPPLRVTDTVESPLRNLIAYEQWQPNEYPKYVSDYISFMDWLINSSKDVELLRRSGIIQNWIGDDAMVDTMLNKVNRRVMLSATSFNYSEISNNVNKHCRQQSKVWMANLKRNYFSTPWTLISFLAAVLFLLSNVAQTVFSFLAYVSPNS